jgi:hypothetical protein
MKKGKKRNNNVLFLKTINSQHSSNKPGFVNKNVSSNTNQNINSNINRELDVKTIIERRF